MNRRGFGRSVFFLLLVLTMASCASQAGATKNVATRNAATKSADTKSSDPGTIHGFVWGEDKSAVMASLKSKGVKAEEGNILLYKIEKKDSCNETFRYNFSKSNQLYSVSVSLSSGLAFSANARAQNIKRVRDRAQSRVNYFTDKLGPPDKDIGYDFSKSSLNLDFSQAEAEWLPSSDRTELKDLNVKLSFSNISKFLTFIETCTNPGILSAEEITGEKLMSAVLRSEVGTVQSLLDSGADPNYVDNRGLSPLFMNNFPSFAEMAAMAPIEKLAFYQKKEAIFRMLIAKGANVNAVTTFDEGTFQTPLLGYLFSYGSGWNPNIVKLLVDSGAKVDVVSGYKKNMTALHLAVDQKRLEAIKILIQAGCDIHATTSDGVTTAFRLALTQDKEIDDINIDILKVLLEANDSRDQMEEQLYVKTKEVENAQVKYDKTKAEEDRKALSDAVLSTKEMIKSLRG